MSGSVNMVVLVGRLGRDPEIRSTSRGDRIANLSVATSETWRDQQGERKERTTWSTVVIFDDKLVEVAEKYLKKGSQIYLRGALQTRSWEDQQGNKRYATEVVLQKYRGELTMLDSRQEGQSHNQDGSSYTKQYTDHQAPPGYGQGNALDDEISF